MGCISFYASFHHSNSYRFLCYSNVNYSCTSAENALDNLVETFIDDIGVIGQFNAESIANIDLLTHVIVTHYAIALFNVQKFLICPAFWVETLLNKATESDLNNLQEFFIDLSFWIKI